MSRPAASATTKTASPPRATSAIAVHGGGTFERTGFLRFDERFGAFPGREAFGFASGPSSLGEASRDAFASFSAAIPSGSAASSVDAYDPPFFCVTTARGNDADPTHVCVRRS